MDDRTLIERAAKAAGIEHPGGEHSIHNDGRLWDCQRLRWWNPLTDDGDALRLAVKLEMVIDFRQYGHDLVNQVPGAHAHAVCHDPDDPYAATRRAIVRAAASLAMGE